MDPWVYGTGLVLGIAVIVSVLWVWLRRQVFGTGGAVLSAIGVLLVGLSIYSNVQISGAGIQIQVQRLADQVNEVHETTGVISEQVINVADNAQTTQNQFLALTEELRSVPSISEAELEQVRQPVLEARPIDLERLRAASRMTEFVPRDRTQ